MSNKFESLSTDPGPSKRGLEDLDTLEGEEIYNETDAFMKEDICTVKPDSEGASTPGEEDDLFLFARGEVHSCRILLKGLEEFKNGSGLTTSVAKSTVFFCQVPQRVKRAILAIMPFDEGKLPVKYLGVPLISTNLVASNCKILIEKVDRRIDDWKNKSLSFAGRLQLIVSVISSMYVYWASVLVLPSSTVKELEQKMKGFLWQKNSNERAKSKVAWSDVCLPKTEGGLGIRKISDVNRSLISYHLWSIIIHRKSLWVDWIYDHKLKGRSIWDVTPKAKMTWSWRKILQIRELIRPHIRQKIGNGRDTFAWSDNWCNQSPLNRFITPRDIYNAGFSLHAKVADLVSNMNWKWPVAWYDLFPVLIHVHVPVISTNRKDVTIWHDMHGEERTFSTMMVWDTIRQRKQLINWYNVVWFTHCIPRHAFHAWLVCQNKLNTQDRMKKWNMNMSCCPLCMRNIDSHEHLFFECAFANQVWKAIRVFTDMVQVDGKWEDIVQFFISRGEWKSISSIVDRLVLGAAAYYVWQERNARLFENDKRTPTQISNVILKTVRMRLLSIRMKDSITTRRIMAKWDILKTKEANRMDDKG
ncbi:hypothetical protein QVD17_19953 [Tagetes erecta]|uniref:Reverse transcriptase zinc-binding domain-containing protein n=1 Tax=Tagetes erecta TaxID=13708 RepID=A0AAD8NQK1_TARER|nr:hypothetical protein QVD17_19953 [Tagetes erecta]